MNTTFFTCFRAEINSRTYYKKSLFEIYRKKELFVQEAMFNLKCSSASYSWSWSFKISSSLEWANFLNFTLKVGFNFPEWDVYNSVSSAGKLELVEVYTQVRFAGNIRQNDRIMKCSVFPSWISSLSVLKFCFAYGTPCVKSSATPVTSFV